MSMNKTIIFDGFQKIIDNVLSGCIDNVQLISGRFK